MATWLRWLHTTACLAAAAASTQAWLSVKFERLWGAAVLARGWQLPEGFTCLVASAFTVVLYLVETRSSSSRRAVQPGVVLMAGIACAAVGWRWWRGAGSVRGISASFAPWFAIAAAATAVATAAGLARLWLLHRARLL